MKNAIIVTPFDSYSYNVRIKYLEKYFSLLDYSAKVYSSDFDHRKKERDFNKRKNLELIHVPGYRRNLSIYRIYSHYVFSKKIANIIKKSNVDIVYVSGPPNLLFKKIGKIKNKKFKLIFEVGDMWPETIPINQRVKRILNPILNIWSSYRNKYINKCDAIIYECNLFREKIKKFENNNISKTIYLSKENNIIPTFKNNQSDLLKFAYIGSINNIIDINLIISFMIEVNKYRKTQLIIIGDGENKNQIIDLCNSNSIDYKDYGIVYDDIKKKEILKDCSFGFNIMKNSVCVGMTMKSLEYFYWGLAVINNIPADSEEIIKRFNCGFNINYNNISNIAKVVGNLTSNEIKQLQMNSRNVYLNNFDESVIKKQYLSIIKELNNNEK